MLSIRQARNEDSDGIWSILQPVFRAGETYALPRDIGRDEALAYWRGKDAEVFVAEEAEHLLGTYSLRPNRAGGGSHVANCGYITAPGVEGKGIGRALLEHSLSRARERGFRAMQFNFVVSTNQRAVKTWQGSGFEIVGRLPGAFLHPTLGYVDALVMYRQL
jgi:GNAT superfamily N-acetyltransferase